MITKNVLDWLEGQEVISPLEGDLMFKIPVNERFWAIYSGSYTKMEKMFTDLWDVRFVALWDDADKVFRIRYEEESAHKIAKMGLGTEDDVAFLPDRFGCADGFKNMLKNKLENILKTESIEQIEERANMNRGDLRNDNIDEIDRQANLYLMRVTGLGNLPLERWGYGADRLIARCSQYLLQRWDEQFVVQMLEDERTMEKLLEEYMAGCEADVYLDVLMQKLVDDRIAQLEERPVPWIRRKIEFFHALQSIEDNGGLKPWVYFTDEMGIGMKVKGDIDEMRADPMNRIVNVSKNKIDIMKIYMMQYKSKYYFEQRGKVL